MNPKHNAQEKDRNGQPIIYKLQWQRVIKLTEKHSMLLNSNQHLVKAPKELDFDDYDPDDYMLNLPIGSLMQKNSVLYILIGTWYQDRPHQKF